VSLKSWAYGMNLSWLENPFRRNKRMKTLKKYVADTQNVTVELEE